MIETDILSLVVMTAVGVCSVLSILLNPFLRRPRTRRSAVAHEDVPLSLVVISHGDAERLERVLPLWMSQRYGAEVQIVVVLDKGNRAAEDVVKRLALQATFIPQSSRYVSRRRLAVTLGIKAARHERVMIVDEDCSPASAECLHSLAPAAGMRLVLPFVGYGDETAGFRRFYAMRRAYYLLRCASRRTAYAAAGPCLLIRKEAFISGGGYEGSLHLVHGEYDFLVNKFATPHTTQVAIHPDTAILRQAPTRSEWQGEQVSRYATRPYMQRGRGLRWAHRADTLALHLGCIVTLAALVWSLVATQYLVAGVVGAWAALTATARVYLASVAMRLTGQRVSRWLLPAYEIRVFWHDTVCRLRYMATEKTEFSTHKI